MKFQINDQFFRNPVLTVVEMKFTTNIEGKCNNGIFIEAKKF